MRRLVQRIWDEARPVVAGDEVDRYLRGRGLTLHRHPPVLRFHPSLGYFEKGADGKSRQIAAYPAMLALIQAPDGQAVTLHRTYLRDGRKLDAADAKKVLSAGIHGAAVRLFDAGAQLALCEGIETALAVHLATGKPVWAGISAGNLEKLWVPDTVREVCIYADNDAGGDFCRPVLRLRARAAAEAGGEDHRPAPGAGVRAAPCGHGLGRYWCQRATGPDRGRGRRPHRRRPTGPRATGWPSVAEAEVMKLGVRRATAGRTAFSAALDGSAHALRHDLPVPAKGQAPSAMRPTRSPVVSRLVAARPGDASRRHEGSPGDPSRPMATPVSPTSRPCLADASPIHPGRAACGELLSSTHCGDPCPDVGRAVPASHPPQPDWRKSKSGRTLVSLAQELERQLHSKKDLIVPSQLVHHSTGDDGQTHIIVNEAGNPVRYGVTPLARRQLADKLKIPHAYFERMREEQPVLLDRNVNTWLQSGTTGACCAPWTARCAPCCRTATAGSTTSTSPRACCPSCSSCPTCGSSRSS